VSVLEALRSLARAANVFSPKFDSFQGLTRLLRNKKIINPATSALLDDLLVMGNQAASAPDTLLTVDDARRFRALAQTIIARLGASAMEFNNRPP